MRLQKNRLGKVSITVDKQSWTSTKCYRKLTIVREPNAYVCYISIKSVPKGIDLTDENYWFALSSLREDIQLDFNRIVEAVNSKISESEKGSPNGVATLDGSGKVISTQLPSYVDDIIDIIGCYNYYDELYRPLVDGKLKLNPTASDFTPDTRIPPTAEPGTYFMALYHNLGGSNPGIYHYVSGMTWTREYGETGKIYVESSTNKQYRFAEEDYVPHEVVASPGTLDAITEGAVNKHFTATEKTKLSGITAGANVFDINYDTNSKKITKTSNGTDSDVVSADTLKIAMSLNNVTNDKQIKGLSSGIVEGHLLAWGIDGYTVDDAGFGEDVLERNTNKVTSVRDSSTAVDSKYPSEKAVRTAIDSKKTSYNDLESNLQGKVDNYDGHIGDAPDMSPLSRGLYKIAITEHGHVSGASGSAPTAVAKSDLTGLGVEDASNKVTSIDNTSTDTQYPSAKCVYDTMGSLGIVYDVSARNNGATFASLQALLSDVNINTLIPTSVRKGGMSIKFVRSSDNNYVQFFCTADEFTTDVTKWQGVDDEIKSGSKNLAESGAVAKVNGYYLQQTDYIRAVVSSNNRLLFGIKQDGDIVLGFGVPTQVKDYVAEQIAAFDDYDDIVTFLGSLIKGENTLTEILSSINDKIDEVGHYIFYPDYIRVVCDSQGRITEATTLDGKKFIGEFADETKVNIGKLSSVIQIPELDANFIPPIDVTITGTKGEPNAKYEFGLHLDDNAFNIRFKFRLTENILNQNKAAVIAKLGNATVVKATSIPLVQETTTVTYQGQTKTNYWPCLANGISFIGSLGSFNRKNNNIGHIAFSIKYLGNEGVATIQNTGTSFILKIGSITHTFDYTTYPTVSELYDAIKAVENISVDYRELNHKNCSDIAIFPECNIKPTMYTGTTGQSGAPIVEYVDTAEFMVPYAVDDSWHYVEVVKINDTIYRICDGESATLSASDLRNIVLTLGGECGVVFKDLEIHTNSAYDAEVVNGVIISSFNPYLIVYEGHGIDKVPSTEATVTDNMNTTIDRLEYVFSLLRGKGYVPVSVKDIAEWYNGNKDLPKRCYTLIFDDFRFDNVLDIDNRSVFTRFGVKPALAIISDRFQTTDIYHNGVVISDDKAVEIANMYNFDLIGHTRNHRYNGAIKPSDMINELTSDVYANELCGVNGEYFVFPYGSSNPYMYWCMKWLGYYLGFNVWNGSFGDRDTFSRSKYNLVRYEIGMRENISNILIGIK